MVIKAIKSGFTDKTYKKLLEVTDVEGFNNFQCRTHIFDDLFRVNDQQSTPRHSDNLGEEGERNQVNADFWIKNDKESFNSVFKMLLDMFMENKRQVKII